MSATKTRKRSWKSITIKCENCESCDQVIGGDLRVARRELKERGWSSKHVDGKVLDYCPQCTSITQMYHRRRKP